MKPRRVINKIIRKIADSLTTISRGRIININSKGKGAGIILSNFTKAPFTLDNVRYESFEGFWQGLKFQEGSKEREKARNLSGIYAKRIGVGVNNGFLYYNNKKIPYNSKELYNLAKSAERKRFIQNPDQLKILLETRKSYLIHIAELKDSKSLPRKIFCKILMELRDELKNSVK